MEYSGVPGMDTGDCRCLTLGEIPPLQQLYRITLTSWSAGEKPDRPLGQSICESLHDKGWPSSIRPSTRARIMNSTGFPATTRLAANGEHEMAMATAIRRIAVRRHMGRLLQTIVTTNDDMPGEQECDCGILLQIGG